MNALLLLLAGLSLVPAVGAGPREKEVLAWWKFDEGAGAKAKDSWTGGNDGTVVNARWGKGVDGAAISFEGKDDYVIVPHSRSINIGKEGQDYSVEFWFKSSKKPRPDAHFLTKEGSVFPFSFVQGPEGEVQLRIYDDTAVMSSISSKDITDGKWHHVLGVRDAGHRKLLMYVDGGLVGEKADTTMGDLNNKGPVKIGRSWGDDFNGIIDGVKIYGFVVSASKKGKGVLIKSPEAPNPGKP